MMEEERADGRTSPECRPTYLRTDVVSGATGSAYGEFGRTKVVVSVFGPRRRDRPTAGGAAAGLQLECHVRIPFRSENAIKVEVGDDAGASEQQHRQRGSRGASAAAGDEIALSDAVRRALLPSIQEHKLLKTCLEVQCTVVESDGSEIGPIIVCASLALAASGVPLYDLVTCCRVACVGRGRFVMDPTGSECRIANASMTVAFMPSRKEVCYLDAVGDCGGVSPFGECFDACLDGCHKVLPLMRKCLLASA